MTSGVITALFLHKKQSLFNCNLVFWDDYCYLFLVRESVKQMTENYDEAHRGRELVTFSDYCVYESMVKKNVGELKQPALDTLRLIRGCYSDFNLHLNYTWGLYKTWLIITVFFLYLRYCAEGVQGHVWAVFPKLPSSETHNTGRLNWQLLITLEN